MSGGGSDPGSGEAGRDSDDRRFRTVLITGATSGLGREVALRLGAGGDRILVHGRDAERGREVVRRIQEEGGAASFHRADFASLDEVRGLASTVAAEVDRLHVLINNAGIYRTPPERAESEDGHELRFQVNHLAHFLLTLELLPLLRAAAETDGSARIVHVASGAQDAIDFDDVMLEEGFDEGRAYGQSKLAQILFTFELAERLEGTGIATNALHPETHMDTKMIREAGREPRSTPGEGAEGVLHLVDDDVGGGRYFDRESPARAHPQAYDAEARRKLWDLSEELVGLE